MRRHPPAPDDPRLVRVGDARRRRIRCVLWLTCSVACATPGCFRWSTRRVGDPLTLASGDPSSDCERARWVDLAPSVTVRSRPDQSIGVVVRTHTLGYGLFPRAGGAAIRIEDMLPQMGEARLASTEHRLRVASTRTRESVSLGFAVAGLALFAAGMGFAVYGFGQLFGSVLDHAQFDPSPLVYGFAFVASSVAVFVPALAVSPNSAQSAYAGGRSHLFIPGEDEMGAVTRGVARHNERVRTACRERR